MCGILGVFHQRQTTPVCEDRLRRSAQTLRHRGPNALGVTAANALTGLAHTRLAILDLNDQSNQPFRYRHLLLSYNGEIYNYLELREELKGLGYDFRTDGDTEVIPAAYLQWGEGCVQHFNGMWAFALYDEEQDLLFCSRDRFGVKPFNYGFFDGSFLFASEIKALLAYEPRLRKPNYNAISKYCRETVGAQALETWVDGVFRLPPGHNLVVRRSSQTLRRYYWYPSQIQLNLSEQDAIEKYRALFLDSVKLRMRSDVAVGLTLSGGLDSASIACAVRKTFAGRLNAYTASFPGEPFDEYGTASRLCRELNLDSIEVRVPYDDYVSILNKIVFHLESGHGSPAIYPLWWIAERAKQDIVVYLEGQGADELLAGYVNSTSVDYWLELLGRARLGMFGREVHAHWRHWHLGKTLMLYCRQSLPAPVQRLYRSWQGLDHLLAGPLRTHHDKKESYTGDLPGDSGLNRRLLAQHTTGLVNLLHYGDGISMAHSLENRLPFIDYRLVDFVFQLPANLKIRNGFGKYVHREAFRSIVPDYITQNARKLGFVSPLRAVFQQRGSDAEDCLIGATTRRRGLFESSKVERLLSEHRASRGNHERMLFKMLSTELWFRNFIDCQ